MNEVNESLQVIIEEIRKCAHHKEEQYDAGHVPHYLKNRFKIGEPV
jgi:hypothetical protein